VAQPPALVSNPAFIVTGGAGFIGSHLVERLLADGGRVVVVDDLSSGRAENVAAAAELEAVDITDAEALHRIVAATRPSAVFHLAAQSSVTASVTDPARDCDVNVRGTLNVLEAAKRHSAPVVFASTGGALYGNKAPLPTPETWLPAPVAPYGASKWAGEAYVSTWSTATSTPHTICRLGNVYGPRQSPHGEAGVVAIFTHKLWRGERPIVYGFGAPTRDYVHVDDVAAALVSAVRTPGTFNIATGTETNVSTILATLQASAGVRIEPVLAPLRAGELERSRLDCSRAADLLGWTATVALEDGLRATFRALVEEFDKSRSS
jgi:UDP-glucose 4-epimerase